MARLCFPKESKARRVPRAADVGDRWCAEFTAQALFFVLSAAGAPVSLQQVAEWLNGGCEGVPECEQCPFSAISAGN